MPLASFGRESAGKGHTDRPAGGDNVLMPSTSSTLLIVASAFVMALAAGCATTPVPTSDTSAGKIIIDADFMRAGPGRANVLVKRDRGLVGSACTHTIFLDGQAVAELRVGQRVEIYPTAGRHILSVTSPALLCGGGTSELAIEAEPGRSAAYRSSVDAGASLVLQPTAF